jgi:SAM-dependent methyltransferase
MSNNRSISKRKVKSWDNDFADVYTSLRQKEGRLYNDKELALLPDVAPDEKAAEWKIRRDSCNRLKKYLANKSGPLRILEVGCGNGWLANQLAQLKNAEVTGIDINLLELNQASRVFAQTPRLHFLYGDLRSGIPGNFNVIIFASSLQYFSSPAEIIGAAFEKLGPQGEVHLLDTHIYEPDRVHEAQRRSAAYFRETGFEKMARFYFHHSFEDLKGFRLKVLYNPRSLRNRLLKRNPFHWIRITPPS